MRTRREIAYALLRITMGLMFLTFGIEKFAAGIGNFAAGLQQGFAGKLPSFLLTPFAYALPFAEVVIGLLLLLGLLNVFGLILGGVLMIALTFGMVLQGQAATVANNVFYGVVIFLLLWFADYNRFSLDRLLGIKMWTDTGPVREPLEGR
ncbi:MAG TPA: MauE/DoxX family redox-associated membrane protein [Blastocatellia bacterium]|nr:MauE/DoxX family redox-associated membrane protein [Blastocatellia bacterium]